MAVLPTSETVSMSLDFTCIARAWPGVEPGVDDGAKRYDHRLDESSWRSLSRRSSISDSRADRAWLELIGTVRKRATNEPETTACACGFESTADT